MEICSILLQVAPAAPSINLIPILCLIVIGGLLYFTFKKDSKGNRFKISRRYFSILLIFLSSIFLIFLLFAVLTNKGQPTDTERQDVIIAAILSTIGLIIGVLLYSQKKTA